MNAKEMMIIFLRIILFSCVTLIPESLLFCKSELVDDTMLILGFDNGPTSTFSKPLLSIFIQTFKPKMSKSYLLICSRNSSKQNINPFYKNLHKMACWWDYNFLINFKQFFFLSSYFLLSSLPLPSSWTLTVTAASTSPVRRELVLCFQCFLDQLLLIVSCCWQSFQSEER